MIEDKGLQWCEVCLQWEVSVRLGKRKWLSLYEVWELLGAGREAKFRSAKELSGIFDITGGLDASEYIGRMRDA